MTLSIARIAICACWGAGSGAAPTDAFSNSTSFLSPCPRVVACQVFGYKPSKPGRFAVVHRIFTEAGIMELGVQGLAHAETGPVLEIYQGDPAEGEATNRLVLTEPLSAGSRFELPIYIRNGSKRRR